jgi:biopolymer transport protein ExbB/TolQ
MTVSERSAAGAAASVWVPGQLAVLGLSALAGCAFILLLDLVFGASPRAGAFWIGRGDAVFPYPFTIQNAEHVLFFMAIGEIVTRWRVARREHGFLRRGFLPEDDQTVLVMADLGPIRRSVAGQFDSDNGFLPYLIDLSVLQAQASRSVDQTVSVLNATLDLISHKVDLRYQLLRYLAWAIPTVGFVGTVAGIASALGLIDPENMEIRLVTGSLAVAFDTTVIALIWSAIVVLFLNLVQKEEELAVNRAGTYCLKNLINRLYMEQ